MKLFEKINKGDLFESYVQYVYSSLLNQAGEDCIVEKRKKIADTYGLLHEIDVYYEFRHLPSSDLGATIRVLIECKNWKRPVSKASIESFAAKVENIPKSIPVFISNNGYQKGAVKTAEMHGITLITGDQLPSFREIVIGKVMSLLFPNKDSQGEPFWILMKTDASSNLTGEYYCINEGSRIIIPLFMSMKLANDALEELRQFDTTHSFCVRGLTRKHLSFVIDSSSLNFMPNIVFNILLLPIDDSNSFVIEVDPLVIKEHYC